MQRKLASSDLFKGEKIAVVVQNGIVTLAGTVREDWKRISATNVVSSVPGVIEVKNGLQVRETLQVPTPVWKSSESKPQTAASKPARPVVLDPQERVRELVANGNYYVSHGNYEAAITAFKAALAIDAGNYEARSGLQEAQRLR